MLDSKSRVALLGQVSISFFLIALSGCIDLDRRPISTSPFDPDVLQRIQTESHIHLRAYPAPPFLIAEGGSADFRHGIGAALTGEGLRYRKAIERGQELQIEKVVIDPSIRIRENLFAILQQKGEMRQGITVSRSPEGTGPSRQFRATLTITLQEWGLYAIQSGGYRVQLITEAKLLYDGVSRWTAQCSQETPSAPLSYWLNVTDGGLNAGISDAVQECILSLERQLPL